MFVRIICTAAILLVSGPLQAAPPSVERVSPATGQRGRPTVLPSQWRIAFTCSKTWDAAQSLRIAQGFMCWQRMSVNGLLGIQKSVCVIAPVHVSLPVKLA